MEVMRKRYGQDTVKKLRKLEKLDCRLRKAQIDLEILVNCSNNSVVPKFLNFRVATKSLKSSRTYQQCQLSLLHEEIRQKKSNIRVLLGHNDKILKQKSTIQQKKFNNLLKDKKPQHDPEKIVFNYKSLFFRRV